MKTAYLINCHKNIKHVSRLAHRIHSENNHIFIHVDKKASPEVYESLLSYTSDLKNCYISEKRINGKLDDRSLVDIVMTLISDAKQVAERNSIHYSYFVNMSGQDYLIKPINYIESNLENNYPDIYMHYRDAESADCVERKFNRNKALIRYRNLILKCKIKIIRKPLQALGVLMRRILKLLGQTAGQRIIKKGWKYYQGSAWWIFPDCVIDAIEKIYYSPTEFSSIMIDESTTPEETYFQSVVMHLFFSDNQKTNTQKMNIQNLKTYVDFGDLSNRPIVHHPYIITMDDYDKLLQSDCWFARKFDESVDPHIIDKIDNTIL